MGEYSEVKKDNLVELNHGQPLNILIDVLNKQEMKKKRWNFFY